MVYQKKAFQSSRRSFKKAKYAKRMVKPKPTRTGTVSTKWTDLARDGAPFPPSKIVNFQYDSPQAGFSTVGLSGQAALALNSMFDVDKTIGSTFANKQPLYFDTLCSSSLYNNYKVLSWDVSFTIINLAAVPLEIFAMPAYGTLTGWDTTSEISNLPGVSRILLTASGGSKDRGILRIKGCPTDVVQGYKDDAQLSAVFNADPGTIIYGGLLLSAYSGTVNAAISMTGNFRTKCFAQNAIIS